MRIVVCSMGYTGYAAACWRRLAQTPGVELKIFSPETHHRYSAEVIKDLPIEVIPDAEFYSRAFVGKFVSKVALFGPGAIDLGGWSGPPFKALAFDARLRHIRKIMSIDTMWQWSWRCFLSRFRLHSLVRRLDGVVVAGERGRQFARYIGFQPEQIFESAYGYDSHVFSDCYNQRMSMACQRCQWPRQFAFVGRYVPIKGVDVLLAAYRRYREWTKERGTVPWELHCYGAGPLAGLLDGVEGVVDHGFLQPKELPAALATAGVFVMPSMKDPWGVALAEGAGAGLPLIASTDVSSSVDLLRHKYNGFLVPAGDVDRLFAALCWMNENEYRLSEMGQLSRVYAGAYTPDIWVDRYLEALGAK